MSADAPAQHISLVRLGAGWQAGFIRCYGSCKPDRL